jgi:phage-related minor tail protein
MTTSTSALTDTATTLDTLNSAASQFGTTLEQAFAKGVEQGKNFDQILQSVGAKLLDIAAKSAVPDLGASLSDTTQSLSSVPAFADGGVIATPSYFPTPTGSALAGEAGPEAIMPLQRGADGKLGVAGGGAPVVNVSIAAQDVDSFRQSEAQITAALARAVARGRRAS